MTKRRLGQAAVRLYPTEIREARGDELVGTLLDAGDVSLTTFITELVSLVFAASKARSARALSVPIGTLVVQAICWSAVVVQAKSAAGQLSLYLDGGGPFLSPTRAIAFCVLPTVFVAAFTVLRPRLAGLLGAVSVIAELYLLHPTSIDEKGLPGAVAALFLLPFVGSALMLAIPRRAPVSARWLWLLPAALCAGGVLSRLGGNAGVDLDAPVLVCLLLIPIQPAFAVGTALAWTFSAAEYPSFVAQYTKLMIELLSCAPTALLLVALCRRLSARPHQP